MKHAQVVCNFVAVRFFFSKIKKKHLILNISDDVRYDVDDYNYSYVPERGNGRVLSVICHFVALIQKYE